MSTSAVRYSSGGSFAGNLEVGQIEIDELFDSEAGVWRLIWPVLDSRKVEAGKRFGRILSLRAKAKTIGVQNPDARVSNSEKLPSAQSHYSCRIEGTGRVSHSLPEALRSSSERSERSEPNPSSRVHSSLIAKGEAPKIQGVSAAQSRPSTAGTASRLARPGVSAAMLERAEIRHVSAQEAEPYMGYAAAGLLIPYRSLNGDPVVGANGRPFYRLRLDEPKKAKYLSPKSSGCQLYIPPGFSELVHANYILSIVEGEFKSMAVVEAGYACVAIGGITSGAPRDENGNPRLLPGLANLIEETNPSKVAFVGDSDTCLIPQFSSEAVKLARVIRVPLILPRIPLDAPGKGPDDLRERHWIEFPDVWKRIIDNCISVSIDTKASRLSVELLKQESSSMLKLGESEKEVARQKIVRLCKYWSWDIGAVADIEQIAEKCLGFPRDDLHSAVRAANLATESEGGVGCGKESDGGAVVLPGDGLSIMESARLIFSKIAATRTLFYRGGRVHEVVKGSDGVQRLSPVTPVQFRSRIEAYGPVKRWKRGREGEAPVLTDSLCSEEMAGALLESIPASTLLPSVASLVSCPVLAEVDGVPVVLGPGWHDVGGGTFVTDGVCPPPVSLAQSVQMLSELLSEFDFSTPADRSRALASMISPALKFGRWIPGGVPVDICEADASQSGKTYLQRTVAALYREVPNFVVQRNGGVGGFDESVSQKLIDGRPFVLIDNYRGKLDSPFLESVLTATGPVPARVPHRGEIKVDPSAFIFQITSNGAETTRDLANRASLIRIRKRPEGFTFKAYDEGDLYAHVQERQPLYLGYIFEVVRTWAAKGKPRTSEHRHSFREWAQSLDWIVQNIFGAAPLLDEHDEAKHRVSNPRRVWLRSVCIAIKERGRIEAFTASQLAEFAAETDNLPPGIRHDADEASMARTIGKIMKDALGDSDTVNVDGYNVVRESKYSSAAQKDIYHYRFL